MNEIFKKENFTMSILSELSKNKINILTTDKMKNFFEADILNLSSRIPKENLKKQVIKKRIRFSNNR